MESQRRTTSFDLRSARRHRGQRGPLPVWTGCSRSGTSSPPSPATTSAPTAAGTVRTAPVWFRATSPRRTHVARLTPTPHQPPGSHRNPLALNLLSSDRTPIAFVIVWGTARSCSPTATPRWRCYEPPQGMRLLRTAGTRRSIVPRALDGGASGAGSASLIQRHVFMRHVHGRHRAAMTCPACSSPRTPAPKPASESQLCDEHWAERRWIIRERIAFLADPIGHPWPASPSRDPRDAVARTVREPVSLPRLMAVLWHPHRRGAATAYASPNRAAGLAAGRAAGATAVAGQSR